ncbi:MAG: ABC transporter substrate-binding protein [Clostridia bacterium]|nr:ABC transporter substrate-binding protein [Clostridia bacterium]
MKRIGCALLMLALLLTLPMGCKHKEGTLKRVELHEVTRSVFYAPQYVALNLGYFEKEGLEVSITTSGGSDKAMTALLSGDADICLAGPETAVYVYNAGQEKHPVVVGQLTKRDGSFLLSRTDEPGFTWESLKGKTIIGGRKGGMPLMTLCYVLRQHGLTPGMDVEVIDSIQFNMMGPAFEGGTGDYVTLFEPTATQMQNAGKGHIVANVGLESGSIPYTAYLVTPEKLEKDPETVTAFLRAVYRAQQWCATASDEEIARAMEPSFPDTSLESLMIVAHSYRETDSWKRELTMEAEDYARLLDVIDGAGELSARPPFGELVDNGLAEVIQNES